MINKIIVFILLITTSAFGYTSTNFIRPSVDNGIKLFYNESTGESGLAIQLINKTGSASVKGYMVDASPTTNYSFTTPAINEIDILGIVLESGIADGSLCWVAIQGKVLVYFSASTTRGHFARSPATADTGEIRGQAISEAVPSTPFATDNHFREIGHVLESRTGAGLAMCVLHFN